MEKDGPGSAGTSERRMQDSIPGIALRNSGRERRADFTQNSENRRHCCLWESDADFDEVVGSESDSRRHAWCLVDDDLRLNNCVSLRSAKNQGQSQLEGNQISEGTGECEESVKDRLQTHLFVDVKGNEQEESAQSVVSIKNPPGSPLSIQDFETAELKEAQDQHGQTVLILSIDSDRGREILGETVEPPYQKTWKSLRLLGRGGYGEVWEVLTDKGIKCAAKTIKIPVQLGDMRDAPTDRELINGFVKSEMNLCRLRHKNIAGFLFITQLEDYSVVLFMELINGVSLEQRLVQDGPFAEDLIREFTVQICNALSYMHNIEPKVIHRDINCANIIVTEDNTLKLIDFGLSLKLMSGSHHSSSTMSPKGTLHFMAPELFGSESEEKIIYSRESDIWAFGCTVYQMTTGKRPYSEVKTIMALAMKVDKSGAPQMPEGCSFALKSFYSCCVAQNRKERTQASELLLHKFLATL